MKYDAIIYDWNGTLIDDVKISHEILCLLLEEYGLKTVSIDEYRNAFTFPVVKYYENVGFDFSKYSFDEVAKKYVPLYDKFFAKCKIFDGAKELISKLKALGVKQYLLSATQKDALNYQLNHFGLSNLFDSVVGTDNFHGKSKVEEGKELIQKEKLVGKKYLLIGDTEYDYEVGKILGADVILCDFGHRPKNALLKVCDKVISSYYDLEKHLLY